MSGGSSFQAGEPVVRMPWGRSVSGFWEELGGWHGNGAELMERRQAGDHVDLQSLEGQGLL